MVASEMLKIRLLRVRGADGHNLETFLFVTLFAFSKFATMKY